MFNRAWTPIGLDVGSRWIKAAQVRRGRAGLQLALGVRLERVRSGPDGPGVGGVLSPQESQRLRGVLERHGFAGGAVVMRVPDEMMVKQVMELPPRQSGAPLDQIARGELARACKCGPEEMEAQWWELPSGARASEGTHMMGVACAHAAAEQIVTGPESAGLRVEALDTLSHALRRACAGLAGGRAGADSQGDTLCMIVDVGWQGATIGVFVGPMLAYERSIPEGGLAAAERELHEQLGLDLQVARYVIDQLGVAEDRQLPTPIICTEVPLSPEEISASAEQHSADQRLLAEARKIIGRHLKGLVDEIRASYAYAGRRFGAAQDILVLVTGGGAGVPGVMPLVRSAAGERAQLVTPADCLPCAPGIGHTDDPALICALGLALHGDDGPGKRGVR